MNFKNFDLNLLVALDALLSERNVTRAAERLRVTQPTMSNALQRIRDHFGDDILSRSGRGMELTPLAESLVQRVRDLLLQAAGVLDVDWVFDPATAARTFRLAMSDYCAMVLMPPLIRRLVREAPDIRCEIVPLSGRETADLLAGTTDVCVTAQNFGLLEQAIDGAAFAHRELFRDRFVCAVAEDHPEIGDDITLEQFTRLPHVVVRFGNDTPSIEEWALQRLGIAITISVVATSFSMLPALVPGTALIATVQGRLADQVGDALRLRRLPPPVELPELVEVMLWHRRSERDKAHRWLRATLAEVAAALSAPPIPAIRRNNLPALRAAD